MPHRASGTEVRLGPDGFTTHTGKYCSGNDQRLGGVIDLGEIM